MSTALDTPATTAIAGAAPATRAERRAQEEAAALASSKPAIKAAKARRPAMSRPAATRPSGCASISSPTPATNCAPRSPR